MKKTCMIALLAGACGAHEPPAANEPEHAAPTAAAAASLDDCQDGAAFLTLWETLDDAQKSELASSDDTSVALAARWERERSVVDGHLDRAGVDRFAAFVGERVAAPPAWWVAALASGVYYENTDTTAYMAVSSDVYHGEPIATRDTLHVEPQPNGLAVTCEGCGRVLLPTAALALDLQPASQLEAYVGPSFAIAIPFDSGSGGAPYTARRIEADGSERWSREVCGGGRMILGGMGVQALEIVRAGDRVAIFGAESHAVYVDVLSIEDGAYVTRWNSDLWFARDGRENRAPAE